MDTKSVRKFVLGVALAGCAPASLSAQVVERESRVTGPGGRTVERSVRAERGPGGIRREVEIRRPAGTYQSQTTVSRGGPPPQVAYGGRPPYGRPGHGRPFPPPPPYYGPPRPRTAGFIGGPFLNLVIGTPVPPPPPVVVYPEPIVVAPPPPPPVVVYQPPVRYAAPVEPETIVIDPVDQEIRRLTSGHDNSRVEACEVLGRLGDSRAVPALADRLKHDGDKEVRIAAAWALADIGDPAGLGALELASAYDKKQDVRSAARSAFRRLESQAAVAATSPPVQAETQPRARVQGQQSGQRQLPEGDDVYDVPPPEPTPYLDQPRR